MKHPRHAALLALACSLVFLGARFATRIDAQAPDARSQSTRVSGIIVSHDGKMLRTGAVVLTKQNAAGQPIGPTQRAKIFPDGAFFFLNVPPGEYILRASGQTMGNKRPLIGSETITVANVAIRDLRITLRPAPESRKPSPPAASTAGKGT